MRLQTKWRRSMAWLVVCTFAIIGLHTVFQKLTHPVWEQGTCNCPIHRMRQVTLINSRPSNNIAPKLSDISSPLDRTLNQNVEVVPNQALDMSPNQTLTAASNQTLNATSSDNKDTDQKEVLNCAPSQTKASSENGPKSQTKTRDQVKNQAQDEVKATRPYRRRFPKVIIFGVKKCGTGALIHMLRQHPNIAGHNKETYFFGKKYHKGFEYYRQQMSRSWPNQITIEKTPKYFVSHVAPRQIKDFNADMKLLLIVKDPIARLISDHRHSIRTKAYRDLNLTSIINDHQHRSRFEKLLQNSYYGHYFSRWLQYFPRNHIHIIDGQSYIQNPAAELAKIESFLNLQRFFKPNLFKFVSKRGYYCYSGHGYKQCLGKDKGHRPIQLGKGDYDKLKQLLKDDVKLFLNITGMRFTWDSFYLKP